MFQPACGYVLDVLGLVPGLALFATAWSLISMAHGNIGLSHLAWQVDASRTWGPVDARRSRRAYRRVEPRRDQ